MHSTWTDFHHSTEDFPLSLKAWHQQKGLANIYAGIDESGLGLPRPARPPYPFVAIDIATDGTHDKMGARSHEGLTGGVKR